MSANGMSPQPRTGANEAQFYKISNASTYQPPDRSHVVSRSTVKVLPQNGGSGEFSSRGGRLICFSLPASGFLDTQNSYIQFKFRTPANGAGWKVMGGLFSTSAAPFSRMRLLVGGQQVEDISNYNTLHQALWRLTVPQDMADSISGEQQGYYGPDARRNFLSRYILDNPAQPAQNGDIFEDRAFPDFWTDKILDWADTLQVNSGYAEDGTTLDASANIPAYAPHKLIQCIDATRGKTFVHSPMLGLLNNWRYIPLAYLGEVQLEIFMDDYETVVKHTANTAAYYANENKYILSDVCYQADIVQFDDMYIQSFEAAMAEKSIHIPYNTVTSYKQSINSIRADIQLQHRSRNVKSLFLYPRRQNYIREARANSFMSLGARAITAAQVRVGPYQKPMQPIEINAEPNEVQNLAQAYAETMKALSFFGNVAHCPAMDTRQFRDGAFMLGLDLEREAGSSSGVDTATESTPIVLSLQSGHQLVRGGERALGANNIGFDLDIFVHHENVLILNGPHRWRSSRKFC